jgi:hypothetical protein
MNKHPFLSAAFLGILFFLNIHCTNTNPPTSMTQQDPFVIGTISGIEPVEIPNKAKGKPSRMETRITLVVSEAQDSHGNVIPADAYDDPTFAGPPELINRFKAGEKVKIVCTSSTGRHIRDITKVK